MDRRDVLAMGSIMSLAGLTTALAAEQPAPGATHEHHAAGGHNAELAAAASHCVVTGDTCLAHCLTMLGQGEKELAACAKTVRDTIAACAALREFAAADSPRLRELSKVVSSVCADCEAECRKHEKHAVCRDCGKACRECKDLCDKAVAA